MFIGVLLVVVVGIVLLAVYSTNQDKKQGGESAGPVSISYEGQPYMGEEDAPVKVIEFGDYKCPFCKDFEVNTVPSLVEDIVEPGYAQFYFMNTPFINVDSDRGAQFAEAVYAELGSDPYWEFHSKLFQKQPNDPSYEEIDLMTEQYLTDTLSSVVSDEEAQRVVEVYDEEQFEEAVQTDLDYANDLQISQTPTLVVNGEIFEGNYEELVQHVKELAEEE
ncbi:thiol-disulfide oxidoreductase [Pontibacillus halophilus JSM 076056 = DSM 19796]|uniref:Thiol-disulfide oxidoreductase n=1 Tax=Pontibacillus halophilus JSM 076056 = DSM 19796 TaxID=1385510 RepID=A0A0A5GMJ8_9BACI|nr:thiol-disulfide oxidoreductase [Pontibacillus halophilus JSM 076056 = DSM 19796]